MNHAPDPGLPQPGLIEVFECVGRPTEYTLGYGLDIVSEDFPLLKDDRLSVDSTLSVIAEHGDARECLVKGPVYGQDITFLHGGERSVLNVLGSDARILMDRESKARVFADGRDSDAVRMVLREYDLAADVEDTPASYSVETGSLIQRETDYQFVRRLARQNGFLFWVTPDIDSGDLTGHFRRPALTGEPSGELIINRLTETNVRQLGIEWNIQTAVRTAVRTLDFSSGDVLDGSLSDTPLPSLGDTPLSAIVKTPATIHCPVAGNDTGGMVAASEGLLLNSTFFLQARCQTTATVARQIFRPHTLVQVSGAGSRHSGLYYCFSVHHKIDETEHVMNMELVRNGWNA